VLVEPGILCTVPCHALSSMWVDGPLPAPAPV
jgi:hypothetical protein